jgi:hypothetical protein
VDLGELIRVLVLRGRQLASCRQRAGHNTQWDMRGQQARTQVHCDRSAV